MKINNVLLIIVLALVHFSCTTQALTLRSSAFTPQGFIPSQWDRCLVCW